MSSMSRRLLVVTAVLLVYAWGLHTLVLSGITLLDQHPFALLRTSPSESHLHPVDGSRQAIIVAEQLMRPGASVAIVYRYGGQVNHFNRTYAYYWASWRMYPRPIVMADSVTEAAAGAPDYILDIGDPPPPSVFEPPGYRTLQTHRFGDDTTMTVLVRA
jgi:hypothetical protein